MGFHLAILSVLAVTLVVYHHPNSTSEIGFPSLADLARREIVGHTLEHEHFRTILKLKSPNH